MASELNALIDRSTSDFLFQTDWEIVMTIVDQLNHSPQL